jgi:hypothetical protein
MRLWSDLPEMLTHPGGSLPGDLAFFRYRSQIEPRIRDLPGSVYRRISALTAAHEYYHRSDSYQSLFEG